MKKKIEFDELCNQCDGTGLYVGMGEKNGAAVVCHKCNGTGKFHFEHSYEEFVKRKKIIGIKRVYECNPGIGIGEKEGLCKLEDFGGMSYKEWKEGNPFPEKSEMRKYTCPAWWYQCSNYSKKPYWDDCIGCGSFSGCKSFKTKEKCWERFDKESRE